MLNAIIDKYKSSRFLRSRIFLLLYAHIIALIHGVGFLIQGEKRLEGPIKFALSNVDSWHGGLPAISVFSVAFIAGIFISVLVLISVFLALFNSYSPWNWILVLAIFVSGGGFVYLFLCVIVNISLHLKSKKRSTRDFNLSDPLFISLFVWLVVSWSLGWVFPDLMHKMSMIIFIIFDILIPIIILWNSQYDDQVLQNI